MKVNSGVQIATDTDRNLFILHLVRITRNKSGGGTVVVIDKDNVTCRIEVGERAGTVPAGVLGSGRRNQLDWDIVVTLGRVVCLGAKADFHRANTFSIAAARHARIFSKHDIVSLLMIGAFCRQRDSESVGRSGLRDKFAGKIKRFLETLGLLELVDLLGNLAIIHFLDPFEKD